MEKATDKQIKYLKALGMDVPAEIPKQTASDLIKNLKANSQAKVVKQPQIERVEYQQFKKPYKQFDNSSYYVAYAKDLVVAMITSKDYVDTSFTDLMKEAIAMVSLAKDAFDKSLKPQ